MRHASRYSRAVEEHLETVRAFWASHEADVDQAARAMAAAVRRGGKILFFGNGGSASDAQHLAAELVNRMVIDRPAIAALALTTDTSILTSVANDSSYERVFERQIQALGRPGDVAFALSTSGESPNILKALAVARERSLLTVALLGRDGGRARGLCDHPLVVPAADTARVQEAHIMIGHLLCEAVEAMIVTQGPDPV